MPYKFPNVSFDWLGELPGLAEESRLTKGRQAALADLDSTDPKSLRAAGNRLIALGGLKEIEMGTRLHNVAQQRESLSVQAARDQAYNKNLPALLQLYGAGRSAPAAGAEPAEAGVGYTPPSGGPPLPQPNWGVPGPLPPQAAPPPATPPAGPAPFNPNMTGLSPTNEMIARSTGGAPPPPIGPQLAGPPPTPDTAPAGPPSVPGLEMSRGAQAPVMRTQPLGGPEAPPAAAPQRGPRPTIPGLPPEDQTRLDQLGSALVSMGPRSSPGQLTAVRQEYQALIDRSKLSPDAKNWHIDRADRWERGLPDISFSDWKAEPGLIKERYAKAEEAYGKYRDNEQKGIRLGETLTNMRTVMDNPRFATGDPSFVDSAQKNLVSIVDTLRAVGVPDNLLPSKETIAGLTQPSALRDAFTSLSNQAVINYLGSLGVGISSTDRDYISGAFPSLSKTPEGNKLIIQFLQQSADRQKKEGEVARAYMDRSGNTATRHGMDAAVERVLRPFAEANPILVDKDGKRTALGRKIEAEIAKTVPTAPTAAGPQGGVQPGTVIYDQRGRPHRMGPNGQPVPIDTGD